MSSALMVLVVATLLLAGPGYVCVQGCTDIIYEDSGKAEKTKVLDDHMLVSGGLWLVHHCGG